MINQWLEGPNLVFTWKTIKEWVTEIFLSLTSLTLYSILKNDRVYI
jgi:hypothetical protein